MILCDHRESRDTTNLSFKCKPDHTQKTENFLSIKKKSVPTKVNGNFRGNASEIIL